jgi:thioredoxin reductase (NADPH)
MGSYDVVIVGAGIAGLSAAIYTARQNLSTVVVGKDLGGQLLLTDEIQNYPGFTSISGVDLIRRVERQARAFGAEVVFDEVVSVDEDQGGFRVRTAGGDEYLGLALILAFGKTPRDLGVLGEDRLKGRGVSYCAICDAALYKGRDVALVSWGEPAYEAASILNNVVNRFYWIYPGQRPVPDEEFLNEVRGRASLLPNHEVVEIRGGDKVDAVVVRDRGSGEVREIKVDAVFIEVGYVAKTSLVSHLVKLNDKGEIIIDEYCRTSHEGIFAAGDVAVSPYKQAVIAAAQGVIAALTAYSYVMRRRGKEAKVISDWRKIGARGEERKERVRISL